MTKLTKEEAEKRLKELQKEKAKLKKESIRQGKEVEKELVTLAKNDLLTFVQLVWSIAGTQGKFKKTWHVEAICEHLQALAKGDIKMLGINIQPRLGKSTICSVIYPVWRWLQEPNHQFITASYGDDLSKRDSVKSRNLILSNFFQQWYGDIFQLSGDQNVKSRYENTHGGYRISTSVKGKGTGEGADCQTPYTKIYTNKGNIPIVELYDSNDPEIKVLTYNHKKNENEWLKPKAVLKTNLREDRYLVRIHFNDKSTTDCTNDHKWYSPEFGYIKAENLDNPVSILSWERGKQVYRKVERVEFIPCEDAQYQVYTLSMPPNGNYYVSTDDGRISLCLNSLLIDDPHKAQDADYPNAINQVINWYSTTISNRYNNPNTFSQLLIHQRICEGDLIGYLKSQYNDFCHLVLPCEFEGDKSKTLIGWQDPRTEKGELLAPELFNKKNAEKEKLKGDFYWHTQYQQNPTPDVGGILNHKYLTYYDQLPLIKNFDTIFTSWDLAEGKEIYEELGEDDYTVGQVWGVMGRYKFLIDQFRDRITFTEQKEEFYKLKKKYPQIQFHLIEKKSNGAALINHLKQKEQQGKIIEINPKDYGDTKLERFNLCIPNFHARDVLFPNINIYSKFEVNRKEIMSFPKGRHKDTVDATTQALNYIDLNYKPSKTIIPQDHNLEENTYKMFNYNDYYNAISEVKTLFEF